MSVYLKDNHTQSNKISLFQYLTHAHAVEKQTCRSTSWMVQHFKGNVFLLVNDPVSVSCYYFHFLSMRLTVHFSSTRIGIGSLPRHFQFHFFVYERHAYIYESFQAESVKADDSTWKQFRK